MRIGIAKPDHRIVGGFEVVLDRVATELEGRGHEVVRLSVDVAAQPRRPYGLDVPDDVWHAGFELFRHVALTEAFERLDTRGVDLLLSTQPPSYAAAHPRHLSLFYHHLRVYYDLSDVFVAAGFTDPALHRAAEPLVRSLDGVHLPHVGHILAGSETVRERLATFSGRREGVGVFHAGLRFPVPAAAAGARSHVLCVTRHEFPKRAELFVLALKHCPDVCGVLTGSGGRLDFVRSLDARLSAPGADLDAFGPRQLWLNRGEVAGVSAPAPASNVRITGRVADDELERLYRDAVCVVAPAYLEDYGLTAIEAMAYGRPVVVCADGGSLADLVEDGVNGLVAAPDGRSVAAAVRRLVDDPELAGRLGAAARETAAAFTWERSMRELLEGMEHAMAVRR